MKSISDNRKLPWNYYDDYRLKDVIAQYGFISWTEISSLVPGRSAKQCRERWVNHLSPDVKNGDWTPEEDRIIICLQRVYGNKWSKISKMIPKRTDNAVKNRFHFLTRFNRNVGKQREYSQDTTSDQINEKIIDLNNISVESFKMYDCLIPSTQPEFFNQIYESSKEYSQDTTSYQIHQKIVDLSNISVEPFKTYYCVTPSTDIIQSASSQMYGSSLSYEFGSDPYPCHSLKPNNLVCDWPSGDAENNKYITHDELFTSAPSASTHFSESLLDFDTNCFTKDSETLLYDS